MILPKEVKPLKVRRLQNVHIEEEDEDDAEAEPGEEDKSEDATVASDAESNAGDKVSDKEPEGNEKDPKQPKVKKEPAHAIFHTMIPEKSFDWGPFKLKSSERRVILGEKAGQVSLSMQCICPYHSDTSDPSATLCQRTKAFKEQTLDRIVLCLKM